jgi:structural maintenance of chromosome 4
VKGSLATRLIYDPPLQFKAPIEKASEEIDVFNEDRSEKLNRVRVVEAEKKALEPRKKEADEFLRDQNRLTEASSKMYQVYRYQFDTIIEKQSAEAQKEADRLAKEREAQAETVKAAEDAQKGYDEVAEGVKVGAHAFALPLLRTFAQVLEVETRKIEKELQVFEQQDAQMTEEAKHHQAKQKKLKKSLSDDSHAKSETASESRNRKEEVAKFTAEIAKLEKSLEMEEVELDKIRDSLKGGQPHRSLGLTDVAT